MEIKCPEEKCESENLTQALDGTILCMTCGAMLGIYNKAKYKLQHQP